ncbi:metallophosphoesterase family protein [Geminicoccus flavidas]|uniref:metallophosphoesterase family protein n=1 Tax=Geminicoccus flavidas TaxID=2506407 RepID=UPI001357C556|nr:metallophosphoesterase [Geminicoccus flavidas]
MPSTSFALAAPPGPELDSLLVSDLHLGLPNSRSAELLRLLDGLRFSRLILLGDILHAACVRRLSRDDWALVEAIRDLRERPGGPLVLPVAGNHDRACKDLVARLLGVPVAEQVAWDLAGRRFLAMHGDRFDRFVSRHLRAAAAVSALFACCHRLSRHGHWPHALDQLHVRLSGLGRRMAEAALAHAHLHDADVIFCGHTHQPFQETRPDGTGAKRRRTYVNTGAWTGACLTFGTVSLDGDVRLHHVA